MENQIMTDHEFLTIIHHEFETNKADNIKLNALLVRLEARFDISSLFVKGYEQTLTGAESRAVRLYYNISKELIRKTLT